MNPTAPSLQKVWDARAMANFIGGSGSGVLLCAALASLFGTPSQDVTIIGIAVGLLVIAAGLFSVFLKIGRPLRALNVFKQPRLSWMSREAWVALLLFPVGIVALITANAFALWITAALALAFLYCQARILAAAKGIPAWREPRIVPLIMTTGLAEGTGLFVFVAAIRGQVPVWLAILLILLLLGRGIAYRSYYNALKQTGAPTATLDVLGRVNGSFLVVGVILAAGLAGLALLPIGPAAGLAAGAGIVSFVAGASFKYALILRAAYNQGFALGQLPTRGAGPSGSAAKSGWRLP